MLACAVDRSLGAPLFTSTGDVKALVDQLNTGVDALNLDVTQGWFPSVKSDPVANEFVNAWVNWRDQQYAFIKDFRGKWFYLAWNWYDTAVAKLNELISWRQSFEQISHRSASGPGPKLPEGAKPVDLEWYLKASAVVAAVSATTWIGFKIYAMSKARRAVMAGARRRRRR